MSSLNGQIQTADPPPVSPAPRRRSRIVTGAAAALLACMAVLMFAGAWGDTMIFDEGIHIGAGYSYLQKADYRMNMEDPPLIKDVAALPLLFLHLQVPWTAPVWTDGHDEWTFGNTVMFGSGVDADRITRAARIPILLLTLGFGLLIFWWTRRRFGDSVALLALFLFCFSPTLLAHGRLVTTDAGAAAGFFVATIAFLHFLERPAKGNVIWAGLAIGLALLTKFSTILLLPLISVLAVAWWWAHAPARPRASRLSFLGILGRTTAVVGVAFLAMYAVYLPQVWNYPPERLTPAAIAAFGKPGPGLSPRGIVLWSAAYKWLRPWTIYFTGLLWQIRYSHSPNTIFFLGRLRTTPLPSYFPVVYAIKEPLALHILTLIALCFALAGAASLFSFRDWLRRHFTEFAFLCAIAIYWAVSIHAKLNIGVRHILPVFPFTFVLVATQIAALYRYLKKPASKKACMCVVGALLAWQAVSVLRVFPYYLAYFNEVAGGPDGGYRYVLDSNLDWGQDLKRLAQFMQEKGIEHIDLNYFGKVPPDYYLKGKYRDVTGCWVTPSHGWAAISAEVYSGPAWAPYCDYRGSLPMSKLVTKIGYSIFVFHLD